MGVAEALDVLGQGNCLLDVPILLLIVSPDGIVDQDAIDGVVLVGGHDSVFEILLPDLAQIEVEAAAIPK
jgi:hypothetical protein